MLPNGVVGQSRRSEQSLSREVSGRSSSEKGALIPGKQRRAAVRKEEFVGVQRLFNRRPWKFLLLMLL